MTGDLLDLRVAALYLVAFASWSSARWMLACFTRLGRVR